MGIANPGQFTPPTIDVLPSTPPTVWVDTNIMLDFYTDTRLWDNERGGDRALEESRMIMQRALWLAMALDQERRVTMGFQHETVRNTDQRAAPGTERGTWVSMVTWVVKDGCCPGWVPVVTNEGVELATTDERDQLMVDIARVDPGSYAFRYTIEKDGTPAIPEDITHVGMCEFRDLTIRVAHILEGISLGMGVALDDYHDYLSEMRPDADYG